MVKRPIYLDYNATTPHDPEVVVAMQPYLRKCFGNPSSSHWFGVQTREAIEKARRQIGSLLNCQAEEIVFTSGGTESNNYAIKGAAFASRDKGNHIITSLIEHPAVTEVCKYLEGNGFKVTYLKVNEYGFVNASDVEKAITPQTILITIMHANNEVGTIQPIERISKIAGAHGITFHTDAAQTVGKIPTNVSVLGVDLLSIAGHKLYAPKGVGALYIRKGVKLAKFVHGAGHEQGRRAGTENVLEIVGFGRACDIAKRDMDKNISHTKEMRDRLHNGLRKKLGDVRLNGDPEKRLPNTLSISFKGIDANVLIDRIKDYVAVSAGAACHSGVTKISHVLKAMNTPPEWARGTIRFSIGRMTTKSEIDNVVKIVADAMKYKRIQKGGDSK